MDSSVLLNITEFRGVNTNSPAGTVMAPVLLQNAYLDRAGGYAPQYAATPYLDGVTAALSAGSGASLFVTMNDGTHYAQGGRLVGPMIWSGSVANATLLMPGLLASRDGEVFILPGGTAQVTRPTPTVAPTGADLTYSTSGSGPYNGPLKWLVVFEVGGTSNFDTDGTNYGLSMTWQSATKRTPFQLYNRISTGDDWRYVGSVSSNSVIINNGWASTETAYPHIVLYPQTATYHQGRVYVAGVGTATIVDGPNVRMETTNNGVRVWFSDVIARASTTSLPRFAPLFYVDVPFRVSETIVALVSVGAYLYIFGDRELWIMTGDPARDPALESIGDSIGTVARMSVQQLSGTVYWLSDSGALAVSGGQVREVGAEVRDQLLTLGSNITATVDFGREVYTLTDGTTTLLYHAREQGWTTRSAGTGVNLLYGGGTPYMVQAGKLWSIGGERGPDGVPDRLPMRVRWPRYEVGSWVRRKTFRGVACGLDLATSSATVKHYTTVDARTDLDASNTQTLTPGNTGVRLHTVDEIGVALTGVSISVELELSTQDTRGILRPPLNVIGQAANEEVWTDNAQ